MFSPTFTRCSRDVTRDNLEMGTPEILTEAFNAPNGAAGFKIKRSPMTLRFQSRPTYASDRSNRTIRLLLFKSSAKPITVSETLKAKRPRPVRDCTLVLVNQNWRSCYFGKKLWNGGFHDIRDHSFFLRRAARRRTDALRHLQKEFPVIAQTTNESAKLLGVFGHGYCW